MSAEILVSVISLIFSIIAIFVSIRIWRKDFLIRRYDVADQLLFEIHKIHLEHPEFLDPEWIRQAIDHPDPKIKYLYDVFATIVWNFLETLYERYGDELQHSSFYGAMQTLGTRHRDWFFREENFSCYNPGLVRFLRIKKSVEDRPIA